jgi:hypothetical protein
MSVASVSSECLQCFSGVFVSVSDACFNCFICLLRMLQLLHLDVSKVDRGLHTGCAWEAASGVGDVWGGAGPLLGGHPQDGVLAHPLSGYRLTLAPRIGRPGAQV